MKLKDVVSESNSLIEQHGELASSVKYWLAADVLGKGHILSGEERAEIVEKHTQKDDTPKKRRNG